MKDSKENIKNTNKSSYKENVPPKEEVVGLMGKMGSYEDKRKLLQEQRKIEYNNLQAEVECIWGIVLNFYFCFVHLFVMTLTTTSSQETVILRILKKMTSDRIFRF